MFVSSVLFFLNVTYYCLVFFAVHNVAQLHKKLATGAIFANVMNVLDQRFSIIASGIKCVLIMVLSFT